MGEINLPQSAAKKIATVPNIASLPAGVPDGSIRYVQDVNTLYTYDIDTLAWSAVAGGGGGGSGTVTSVSVVSANGVSGTVATATTTPAITLALGAITPSSVAAVGTVTGSNLSGTNTGNQTITLTGDVTGSGTGSFAATIATGAVTDTKGSLHNKPSVTVVATTNQTLSGTPTIDGQATAANSLILLTAQTTGSQNGPWVAAAGAWSRPTWYPSGGTTQAGQYITTMVRLGTTYQGTTWRQTGAGPITIDTDASTWVITPYSINSATITGLVPTAFGGTNSIATLNNNRVMKSSGGAIIEAAAITANRALASDANGIPVAATTTDTELGYVSGVTSAIQTQITAKAAKAQTFSATVSYIGTLADGTYTLVLRSAIAGTITETSTISTSGTATATFKINTTALGGTANAVSSTLNNQTQSSANAFVANDNIVVTTSSSATLVNPSFTIKYTTSLA